MEANTDSNMGTVNSQTFELLNNVAEREFTFVESTILTNVFEFYRDPKHLAVIIEIVEATFRIRIRTIDWFVSNYAKKHRINYQCNNDTVYVHSNYKEQLRKFSKKYFDPYCRDHKIFFRPIHQHKLIEIPTSIGQLNFFKWAIEHGILTYVINNKTTITTDNKLTSRINKINKAKYENDIAKLQHPIIKDIGLVYKHDDFFQVNSNDTLAVRPLIDFCSNDTTTDTLEKKRRLIQKIHSTKRSSMVSINFDTKFNY